MTEDPDEAPHPHGNPAERLSVRRYPPGDVVTVMQTGVEFNIRPAITPAELAAVRNCLECYAASLDVDLAYQGFDGELANLPGDYGPPRGALLLTSTFGGAAAGCVGLRKLNETAGEMKRLYVAPQARGCGLGFQLATAISAIAQRLGYDEVRLGTLPDMAPAQRLYRRLGFLEVEPYYSTPVAGTLFMAKRLGGGRQCLSLRPVNPPPRTRHHEATQSWTGHSTQEVPDGSVQARSRA